MDATRLKYRKEYRCTWMFAGVRGRFIGQEGNRYWFVFVKGEESVICSGRFWLSKSQVEGWVDEL
jgi:hypothetical protein